MPMTRDEHEALLNELLNPELEQSRRTEILQQLRTDYASVLTDFDELTKTKEKLEKDNADLVISNSKLFRQLGIAGADDETKKQEEQRSFSETVTVSALEKNAGLK